MVLGCQGDMVLGESMTGSNLKTFYTSSFQQVAVVILQSPISKTKCYIKDKILPRPSPCN